MSLIEEPCQNCGIVIRVNEIEVVRLCSDCYRLTEQKPSADSKKHYRTLIKSAAPQVVEALEDVQKILNYAGVKLTLKLTSDNRLEASVREFYTVYGLVELTGGNDCDDVRTPAWRT